MAARCMVTFSSVLRELKRRNVLRAAALYVCTVWVLAQVITQLGPVFDTPLWVARWFLIAAIIGFPFWVVFAWLYELTPDGLKREHEVASGDSIRHLTGRQLDRAIIAVLAVAVVLLLTNTLARHAGNDLDADLPANRELSVAVLPLANGGGEGQQFFSDGLSESLIIALSQFDGLKVIGRNSSFQFRDTTEGSAVIGRKLGVAHLLEGSVQHAGDVVRVSVELIDAASGQTRWSQHYDRPYKDLFKLQDEITSAVAGALHATLLARDEAAIQSDRPPSGSIEAYTAYLQGLQRWHEEDFPSAAGFMAKAVQLDPGYAMAWAHLSGSWSTVAAFRNEPATVARAHMRTARIAADKALQLAPGLGAAHAARAYLHFYSFDDRAALAECRRAVRLAARDGTVLNGCGYVLGGIGKMAEALGLRERLFSIEPMYTVNYFQYATLLTATGRLDAAEKYLRMGEEMATAYPLDHLKLAVLRGDAQAALAIAGQAPPQDRTLYMTLATQIGPDRLAADQWLDDLLADKSWVEQGGSGDGSDHRYVLAQIYALRGDAGQALEWLERSVATNPSRAYFLLADPLLLRFRATPWFLAFCRERGLPAPSESEALSIDEIRTRLAASG